MFGWVVRLRKRVGVSGERRAALHQPNLEVATYGLQYGVHGGKVQVAKTEKGGREDGGKDAGGYDCSTVVLPGGDGHVPGRLPARLDVGLDNGQVKFAGLSE